MDFPEIQKTASTPSITFNSETKTIHIVGESYPENSFEIYTPVLVWLKQMVQKMTELKVDMNVSYMNSSSTKCILDLLDVLEEAFQAGKETSVRWLYDSENPRSKEVADEFKEEFSLPFHIIPYE
ncbi:MAG: DUF1987 domain-containing protein [Leptonema sp. (in: Bacteria)]|nr:DUF1987 domain-containing protein [Leptonema sp. (in: bacteria)]